MISGFSSASTEHLSGYVSASLGLSLPTANLVVFFCVVVGVPLVFYFIARIVLFWLMGGINPDLGKDDD